MTGNLLPWLGAIGNFLFGKLVCSNIADMFSNLNVSNYDSSQFISTLSSSIVTVHVTIRTLSKEEEQLIKICPRNASDGVKVTERKRSGIQIGGSKRKKEALMNIPS